MNYNMKTSAFVVSHIGTSRQNHEDNFLLNGKMILPQMQKQICLQSNSFIREFSIQKQNLNLFVVCDGMGGHNAGEIASYMAVDILSKLELKLSPTITIEHNVALLEEGINEINSIIREKGKENIYMSDMGSTLTILLINNGKVGVINLGDSRAYRFSDSKIIQITKDNTEGQRLLDLKLLSEDEINKFPSRKNLSKYLGMDNPQGKITADTYIIDNLKDKEWFLLCSDGLTDVICNNDIEKILKKYYKDNNILKASEVLLSNALTGIDGQRGSTDNITVMIIQMEK